MKVTVGTGANREHDWGLSRVRESSGEQEWRGSSGAEVDGLGHPTGPVRPSPEGPTIVLPEACGLSNQTGPLGAHLPNPPTHSQAS